MSGLDLSIIIPTFNRVNMLGLSDLLAAGKQSGLNMEIIALTTSRKRPRQTNSIKRFLESDPKIHLKFLSNNSPLLSKQIMGKVSLVLHPDAKVTPLFLKNQVNFHLSCPQSILIGNYFHRPKGFWAKMYLDNLGIVSSYFLSKEKPFSVKTNILTKYLQRDQDVFFNMSEDHPINLETSVYSKDLFAAKITGLSFKDFFRFSFYDGFMNYQNIENETDLHSLYMDLRRRLWLKEKRRTFPRKVYHTSFNFGWLHKRIYPLRSPTPFTLLRLSCYLFIQSLISENAPSAIRVRIDRLRFGITSLYYRSKSFYGHRLLPKIDPLFKPYYFAKYQFNKRLLPSRKVSNYDK